MLTEEEKDIIIQTMKPYHPVKIGVFRNNDQEIGLLYLLGKPYGIDAITLWDDLEENLNKKISFIDFDDVDVKRDYLQKEILENQEIFYCNEPD
ncbi:MAG: hypothetical protein OXC67_09340 [Flavobacteriaceae bacterium]|nr:hypothetical protein [Flavobacteriaceae bacterium]